MADDLFSGSWASDVGRGARGDALGSSDSIWDKILCGLIYVGGRYLLRWGNPIVCERLGVPPDTFFGGMLLPMILLVFYALCSIAVGILNDRREAREAAEARVLEAAKTAERAAERAQLERERLAREARIKAGHRLP